MEKAYITNIKFNNWQNQLWFMGNDDEETNNKWIQAQKEVENLGESSKDPMEFQEKVIEHFRKCGFIRIKK